VFVQIAANLGLILFVNTKKLLITCKDKYFEEPKVKIGPKEETKEEVKDEAEAAGAPESQLVGPP